jgi:hypothetical protein
VPPALAITMTFLPDGVSNTTRTSSAVGCVIQSDKVVSWIVASGLTPVRSKVMGYVVAGALSGIPTGIEFEGRVLNVGEKLNVQPPATTPRFEPPRSAMYRSQVP